MEGRQFYIDERNGIHVDCEASPKAVAMLRFFADDMEQFLQERKARWERVILSMPWHDFITEAWAAPAEATA